MDIAPNLISYIVLQLLQICVVLGFLIFQSLVRLVELVAQESDNADAAAVIAEQTDPADDNGAADDEVSSALSDSEPNSGKDLSSGSTSGIKELRNKLMPWLLGILLVLIAALCIIIKWLKNKSERRRRKIKTTVGRKSK